MDERGSEELSLEHGKSKLRLRAYDFTNIVLLMLVAGMAYEQYLHREDSRATQIEFALAVKEFASHQRDLSSAVKLQTCVMALPQDVRLEQVIKENSYCNRATK
jgi:hypothetical protein